MPEISPYGVTQHADAAAVTANALVGGPVSHVHQNAPFGQVSMMSTAPFDGRPPHRRRKCRGKNDTCKAPPMLGSDLCFFHTKD